MDVDVDVGMVATPDLVVDFMPVPRSTGINPEGPPDLGVLLLQVFE